MITPWDERAHRVPSGGNGETNRWGTWRDFSSPSPPLLATAYTVSKTSAASPPGRADLPANKAAREPPTAFGELGPHLEYSLIGLTRVVAKARAKRRALRDDLWVQQRPIY
jgi:hypothetical protein